MPAMQETYEYNMIIPGDRLIEKYRAAGRDHSDIDPNKRYKVNMPAQRKVDHYRYLRRIFDSTGANGVMKYIEEIEEKLKSDQIKAEQS